MRHFTSVTKTIAESVRADATTLGPVKAENVKALNPVGLRSKDINAYHVVSEYLTGLKQSRSVFARAVEIANPDLAGYFLWANQEFIKKGANATLP
jgi:hypothetical protein